MNGAGVIAEILKREGTEFLSCYPRNPLIEACAAIDIRPVLCRQERVGVGIADGYSRIRRGKRNGVFAAQAGPGIENAFPGVAQAYAENVPMLIIPAGLPLARQYVRPVFRAAEVYRPVTKWSALAHNVQELPDLMRRAYHAMRSGKGGPVMVEMPDEVFEAEFKGELDYAPVPMARVAPDPDAVKKAVQMLLPAKNPLILAGQGVHYADASEQLAALAELIPAPVATTNPGKSAIAESHPLSLGASTRSRPKMYTDFMAKADLVLAIGSSLTKTPFGPGVPPGKAIIHSTNDAGDINKEYRADHALVGDAALVLDALIAEVVAPEGAWRRQRVHVAEGGDRGRQEGVARRMGEVPRFRRDAAQPVSRHPRPDAHGRPRQRHHDARFRQPARADDAVLGNDRGGLLYGLGQVHAARLRPRHHHRRQARRAEKALRQRDGRFVFRHDRHGHRDGGAQPHRHPHHRVQQRRDGRRARRAENLRREVWLDDGRRQLHQGRRGAERRRPPRREARRHRAGASRRRSASPRPARPICWSSSSRKAATSRAIRWRGL